MEHHLGAAQDRRNCVEVADIHRVEIDGGTDFLQVLFVSGQAVVDHRDLGGSVSQQPPNQRRADETRASGHDIFVH